jgi:3-deoxy-D-manno-octulosonate 8-phosphate phosphatase (KDO 8-P phosphatase)
MRTVKILVLDIDGTLTDGKLFIASEGEIMKVFNVKDGMGIAALPRYGIIPVIITGRISQITVKRCQELKITEIYQGVRDKVIQLNYLVQKFNCSLTEIAYIGDDINDLDCMKLCGITGCPADAVDEVKNMVSYVCKRNGGDGAVREFIEYLVKECALAADATTVAESTA